ncbi:hypothetical protein NFI96_003931 [Prochilodus magdalenae]|nr:hypothetical protein NFI96_003931 [Prochilodus magdalenae]
MFNHQWKQVQGLADTIWDRWRNVFLSTLWEQKQPDLKEGDIGLMKDSQGDSGGPLVCGNTAVGIVSFGDKDMCNAPTKPFLHKDF